MLMINGVPILTSIIEIIYELKNQLALSGVNRFKDIKETLYNINVTCPFHKEGQEQKPSFGILLQDKVYGNRIVKTGTCSCFTCKVKISFAEMVSNCFGYDDKGVFGADWVLDHFTSVEFEDREVVNFNFDRDVVEIESDVQEYVKEEELFKYRYYHDYMFKRGLTKQIIEKFDVGFEKSFQLKDDDGNVLNTYDCITFPVWDEPGNCIFIARRSITGKSFNYPNNVDIPVYGLNFITSEIKEVIVCESIINCLTCWGWGLPAIALLGTGNYNQYDLLEKSHIRKFKLAFDGDTAGRRGVIRFKKQLCGTKMVTFFKIPEKKDVNDLTKEQFTSLIDFR